MKVELSEKNCRNSTFFLFALTSFYKKLADLKYLLLLLLLLSNLTLADSVPFLGIRTGKFLGIIIFDSKQSKRSNFLNVSPNELFVCS